MLVPHLFYLNDINSLLESIDVVKSNPVPGIDAVTKQLLSQLIYHGYYDHALEYSKAVWRPISEADDLIGNPADKFCISIYLNELENCYSRIKNGETIDVRLLKKEMKLYGFNENLKTYQDVIDKLIRSIDKDEIKRESFRDTKEFLLFLNTKFLKFMKDEYNIRFILSDRFFNSLHKPELFGQAESTKGFFYIPFPVLSEHFDNQLDRFFNLRWSGNIRESFWIEICI